jgi:hypothetical protein
MFGSVYACVKGEYVDALFEKDPFLRGMKLGKLSTSTSMARNVEDLDGYVNQG